MVSRLERWAKDARRNGFPEEADLIENQAKVFRKAGVPDDFPQATVEGQLIQASTMELKEGEIMKRLLDVLSSATIEAGRRVLTLELARYVNQQVGQYLGDEVSTQELIIPYRRVERKVKQLNTQLVITYNHALRALAHVHYSTIGSIRDASPFGFTGKNIGDVTRAFVKTAFARPKPPERQA